MLEPILLIDDFSANQISEIRDFLHSHQEVFDNSKQTQTAVAPYRTANKHNEIIKEEVDKMLAKGIISPSKSAWSAPVVLVKKKDGTIRFSYYRNIRIS